MRVIQIILLFVLSMANNCHAQNKFNNAWIASFDVAVRFNDNNTVRQYSLGTSLIPTGFYQGHSNICDSAGRLQLISDGYNLYDSNLNYIDGGQKLTYDAIYTQRTGTGSLESQSSIILPFEGNIFYFVNLGMTDSCLALSGLINSIPPNRMLYHKVDMNLNNGAGKVVNRMVELEQGRFMDVGMMACKHANGKDWWVLKLGADSLRFYTYLLTKDSVYLKGIQSFTGPEYGYYYWIKWANFGQMMFNNVGTELASVSMSSQRLFKFDFDRCHGILSNAKSFLMPSYGDSSVAGVCFSPNDRFIYVTRTNRLLQFDSWATDSASAWFKVAEQDTTSAFPGYSNIYPAPNGKLYIGTRTGARTQMSVIDKPNLKGVACEFCPLCLRLDSLGQKNVLGPPCMPNYNLGALVEPCWPLSISQHANEPMSQLEIFPNPTHSIFYVKNQKGKQKQLLNTVGDIMCTTNKDEIDVSSFAKGVYFIKCNGQTRKVGVE